MLRWFQMNTAGRAAQRFSAPATFEPDLAERERDLGQRGGQEVRGLALVAGQGAHHRRAEEHGHRACGRERAAQVGVGRGPAPAREALHRPAARFRLTRKRRARIGRARVADQAHQRHVLVTVRIEEALRESDALAPAEVADSVRLRPAPQDRTLRLAGEHARARVESRAEHVLDAEVARRCRHLERGRGACEHEHVALAPMLVDDLAHLGIDEGLDLAQVQFLAQRIEVGHALALPLVHAARDQLTVVDAAEGGLEQRNGRAGDRDGADFTAACALLEEREDRVPGNKGAVKVEDRSGSSHVRGLLVACPCRVCRGTLSGFPPG